MKENGSKIILNFIESWKHLNWTTDDSLLFCKILVYRFPFMLDIFYIKDTNEFVCYDGDFYYNYSGVVDISNSLNIISLDYMRETDHLLYSSLMNNYYWKGEV